MSLYQSINKFRQQLRSGRFCLGVGISLSDPAVTEALGRLTDFYWVDLEHTPIGLETLQAHLISARAVGVPAIVRVPGSEPWFIKRVIDAGAPGIIVPQVRSSEEVKRVIDACRYHPEGDRGYGPRRASDYGQDPGYFTSANQDLFVSVQIEHIEAVRQLDEIVEVKGLDSIVVGPFDLAVSMGKAGQVGDPEVVSTIRRIVQTAKAKGLFVGMGGPANREYVLRAVEMGVQWLQSGIDFEYMLQFVQHFFQETSAQMPESMRLTWKASACASPEAGKPVTERM